MKWKKRGVASPADVAGELERDSPVDTRKSSSIDSVHSSSTEGDAAEEGISNCLTDSNGNFQPVFPVRGNDSLVRRE